MRFVAKFIRQREYREETVFRHEFRHRNDPNAGFSFECDANGNILTTEPAAKLNYQRCIDGVYDVIDKGIVPFAIVGQSQRSSNVRAVMRWCCTGSQTAVTVVIETSTVAGKSLFDILTTQMMGRVGFEKEVKTILHHPCLSR